MSAQVETQTSLGRVRGVRLESGVEAYLGMRYAHATGGPLRFAPPSPLTTWATILTDATRPGPPPPQFDHARLHLYPRADEDCLWLNVWTPAADAGARPVMVWIHGGGWLQESACDPVYFGDALSSRGDVVVASIEYRLNVFGFGHFADVAGSGNAGLLDQVAALTWIQDNISDFGGDPDNVTIFGESAGGMSVSALLGMPRARGLFARAIMQSNVASTVRRPDFAHEITRRISDRCLCTSAAEPDLDALRAQPWQAVLEAAVRVADESGLGSDVLFGPVHDGDVFPDTPMRATAAGLHADVPILLGFTHDETRYWYDLDPILAHPDVTAELIIEAMASPALPAGATARDLTDLLRRLEPDLSPVQIGLAGLDDCFFRQPVIRQAEAHHRSAEAPAYLYRLDWRPTVASDHGFDYGCPHATDLGLTLGTADAYPEMYSGECSQGLTNQMMDTWIAFAQTGDPNHAGLPEWPPYDTEQRPTMVFDADGHTATSHLQLDPDPDRRVFWQSVAFDGRHPSFAPDDLAAGGARPTG